MVEKITQVVPAALMVNKIINLLILVFAFNVKSVLAASLIGHSLIFQIKNGKTVCIGDGMRRKSEGCDRMIDVKSLDSGTRNIFSRSNELIPVFSKPKGTSYYLTLIARMPSKSPQSIGYCGAGYEDHLVLLVYDGNIIKAADDFLLQSCLNSVVLDGVNVDDIFNAISVDMEKYEIRFKWMINPDDKNHTLIIFDSKFLLN